MAIGNMPERQVASRCRAGMKRRPLPDHADHVVLSAVLRASAISTGSPSRAPAAPRSASSPRRGNGEQGRFALDAEAQILPYYNDYFGTPYPLPKLDNVAGPGQ